MKKVIEISKEEKAEISELRFSGKNKTLKRRAMIIYAIINSSASNKDIAVNVGVLIMLLIQ